MTRLGASSRVASSRPPWSWTRDIGWGLVFQGVRDFYHFKFIPGEPNFYHFKWFRACNFYRQTNTYPKISLALRAPGPSCSSPDSLSTPHTARQGLTGDAVAPTTTLLSGRPCTCACCLLGHRECQCDDFYRQIVLDCEKSDFYHFKQINYAVHFYRFKFNLPNFYRTPTL